MLKKVLKVVFLLCLFFMVYALCSIDFCKIKDLENNMLITSSEIESINCNREFGKLITVESLPKYKVYASDGLGLRDKTFNLSVKLLGVFPIKTIPVTMITTNEVCAGGNAVGLVLTTDGAVIVGFNTLNTENGKISPFEKSVFKVGDRIVKIAGSKITCISDIESLSKSFNGEAVEVVAFRKDKEIKQEIKPLYDLLTKSYKLGLWVRDDAAGVGTLTFINDNTYRFGALGHGICENNSANVLPVSGGKLYNCDIVGINKGSRGRAGELKGFFINGRNKQGEIDKNSEYGVFGKVEKDCKFLKNKKYEVGGRLSIKPGKASILCCLEGKEVKEYEIEIIKTNYQRKSNDKSLVIRVTDKELIEKTGGIVQGMSGSPIIQNGKIVGAVTHVFVNDPLKGFGVYMDWMYNE